MTALRVLRGTPTDEELAAVLLVLRAVTAPAGQPQRAARKVGRKVPHRATATFVNPRAWNGGAPGRGAGVHRSPQA